MKCIRCGVDSKYKERSGKRCRSCRGEFAFEPRESDILTDAAFKAAIERVSSEGRVRFGVEHLYYEICRRKRSKLAAVATVVFGVVSGGFLLASVVSPVEPKEMWLLFAGLAGLACAASGYGLYLQRYARVSLPQFNRMWERWTRIHGQPKGVIVRKAAPKRPAAEPDIADYSFDRAVICDRARTVDLLLANNFHFENNCAVLAVGGYPAGPFETVRAMLKRNPRLQVFALHDASIEGCRMPHHLAHDPNWFAAGVPVTDVGLRPVHAKPFSGLLLEAGNVTDARHGLSPDEAKWLSNYQLELAAIRPEQVIKRLFRAINKKAEPPPQDARRAADDGGDLEFDLGSFSADASDSDGGGDSFG